MLLDINLDETDVCLSSKQAAGPELTSRSWDVRLAAFSTIVRLLRRVVLGNSWWCIPCRPSSALRSTSLFCCASLTDLKSIKSMVGPSTYQSAVLSLRFGAYNSLKLLTGTINTRLQDAEREGAKEHLQRALRQLEQAQEGEQKRLDRKAKLFEQRLQDHLADLEHAHVKQVQPCTSLCIGGQGSPTNFTLRPGEKDQI